MVGLSEEPESPAVMLLGLVYGLEFGVGGVVVLVCWFVGQLIGSLDSQSNQSP